MPPWLLALRASFTFMTRIPVGGFPYPPQTWKWISLWFPLVGLVLGAIGCLLFWLLPNSLSFWSQAVLIVGVGMLLTGGFHEDGLADTADALGGAYDAERVMVILKDSRIGAFGGMALFVALALRVGLLADLGEEMFWGLLLGQSLSSLILYLELYLLHLHSVICCLLQILFLYVEEFQNLLRSIGPFLLNILSQGQNKNYLKFHQPYLSSP